MPGILIREVEYQGQVTDLLLQGTTLQPYSGVASAEMHVIAGKGLVAIPGLVDTHVHFRDPGLTEKEDLLTGARAAAAGGYCRVLCEPNTRPVIDTVEAVQTFNQRVRDLGIPVHVATKSALTRGQRGEELVDIRALEAVVSTFSDDGEPVVDRAVLARAFAELCAHEHYAEVTAHCEETPRSAAKVRAMLGDGPALAREAEIIALHLETVKQYPTPLHIQHVSLAKSAELLAVMKQYRTPAGCRLPVTSEVTPHHLLLCDEDIPLRNGESDPNWKMNPPLRSHADMLAMRRALADGVIDYIATDHAPHTQAEKAKPWDDAPFGIIGLETALGACLSLVHSGELPFDRLVTAMTQGGQYRGSLTLIDVHHRWTVDPATFYSKARNCPFAGRVFKGKALYTIVDGNVVMAEGNVLF